MSFQTLTNLYEVKKTVKFELKPYIKTREILKGDNYYKTLDSYIKHIKTGEFEKGFDWNSFCVNQYTDFFKKSKKIFQFLYKINNELLKDFRNEPKKEIRFDFKQAKGIFKKIPTLRNIQDFFKLKTKLLEMGEEYQIWISGIDTLQNDKTEHNKKASDVSIALRKLAYLNRNFLTIFSILGQNAGNKTDETILLEKNELIESLRGNFECINNSIIASNENEVSGSCFGKFTFNKYALFRRITTKLEEECQEKKKLTEKKVLKMIQDRDIVDDKGKVIDIDMKTITDLQLKKKSDLQNRLKNFDFGRTLDEVISELDLINGQILNNHIQSFVVRYKKDEGSLSFTYGKENPNGNEKLNGNEKSKEKDGKRTSEGTVIIDGESIFIKALRGQKLDGHKFLYLLKKGIITEKDKENKKLVDKFLKIVFKHDNINPDYNTIKKFRDKLAKWRGKIRQDYRVSEREFVNEAMIKYYANILEKDGNYFLALTEKDKIENKRIDAVEIIRSMVSKVEDDGFVIYKYSQLSFSALEKLCLMKDKIDFMNEDYDDKIVDTWNQYKNQKKQGIDINVNEFKQYITLALQKLKKNSGEDWINYISELQRKTSVEKIVDTINQKFYKLEKKYISSSKVFALAEKGEIQLFQIYNKDFNIFDERFLSKEEYCQKEEYREHTKLRETTTREKDAKKNIFTGYREEIFTTTDVYLGQEGGVFFRKGDNRKQEKRFRNNKFFASFHILLNEGKNISNPRLCEKKADILANQQKEFTVKYNGLAVQKEEMIIMGIDRGSITENNGQNNSEIAMIGYCIIKLKKEHGKYILADILDTGNIVGYRKETKGNNKKYIKCYQPIGKEAKDNDILFSTVLRKLKQEIEKELQKSGKRDLIKIIEKKKGLTGLLVNTILTLIEDYKVDYIAMENLDNNKIDNITFKKAIEEESLSAFLYQNFEIQLLNKLQYTWYKDKMSSSKRQLIPKYKIEDLKQLNTNNWFNFSREQQKKFENYKILGNIIFVETVGTSSVCFNCGEKIKKHKLTCKKCGIEHGGKGQLNLDKYDSYFVKKEILEKCKTMNAVHPELDFNKDIRAGLVIAKRGKEYLESGADSSSNNHLQISPKHL